MYIGLKITSSSLISDRGIQQKTMYTWGSNVVCGRNRVAISVSRNCCRIILSTSDMQGMMWGKPDLADTEVDLGNDAEFGIIIL